jgi:TRAP transporter TAXI family solute receptor
MTLRTLLLAATLALPTGPTPAQEMTFFRIGTGGVSGTYYPIGGLIADIISNPPGARPCDKGGSCGVPGLVAIAQSSNGSVANVSAIETGALESGFVQSDVAYWAHTGTGIFEEEGPSENLRAITNLYPESIQIVARKDAGIETVRDLEGKRVSLDEPGSGTLVDARIILEAHGLTEEDLQAEYLKATSAISKMLDGELDAYVIVAGYPTASVVEQCDVACVLVPIDGPEVEALLQKYPFFSRDVIPAGTYKGVGETKTISVGAQWVVSAEVEEDLVYGITQALWHDTARTLLDTGHQKAQAITLARALDGIAIPLHPGAERFYREAGLIQ